jgi:hypothetical protein
VENKPGFCQKPGLYTRDGDFTSITKLILHFFARRLSNTKSPGKNQRHKKNDYFVLRELMLSILLQLASLGNT